MVNRERAKNYAKKLYSALGRNWNESIYEDYWNVTLMGHEWDRLNDAGFLENDFCAWCGNEELKSGYFVAPRFSMRNVHVSICDDCFMKANSGDVPIRWANNSSRSGCFGLVVIFMTLLSFFII